MTFFMYLYWYNKQFKNIPAGPMKLWELSDNLVRLGHKVVVFAPRIGHPEKQTNAEVISIPASGIPILGVLIYEVLLFLYSMCALLRNKCDVVYVRIMTSLIPIMISVLSKSPIILEVNDDPWLRYESISGIKKFKIPVMKLIDKINFKYADRILPVTERIKDLISQKSRISINKFNVIQSGANIELFRPLDKTIARKKINLETNKKYVGFVGTHKIYYDYKLIIDSAPLIISRIPDVRFLIVGDCEAVMNNLLESKKNNMAKYFIFTGYILYTNVPEYICSTDVCMAPFLESWGDTSAVKIFDYLACGRPVVTTKIGTTSDYLLDSNCVVLVSAGVTAEFSNAIVDLLLDSQRRDEMGKNGRKFILEKYNRKFVAEKVVEITEELLGSTKL